jgi:type IV secretion system protein VirB6
MIGQCAAPRDDLGLVKGLLETVDCNIREGVQGGYAALFGPTSPLTAVITVLLTHLCCPDRPASVDRAH